MNRGTALRTLYRYAFVIACLGYVALPQAGIAQDTRFVSARGSRLVAPDGTTLFLRGINLGNWLVPEGYMFKFKHATSPRLVHEVIAELLGPDGAEEFWGKYRDAYVTREDIEFIKRVGLNSVRVPFNYRLFTPECCPDVWTGPGFAMLDRVISWCREAGIWVVLDMHCAPGGQTGDNIDDSWGMPWLFESRASQLRVASVWRAIAHRYKDEPAVIGYDLLNEPIPHFADTARYNGRLEPLYKEIVRAIREVDRNHLIFLGGAQWNTNFRVFGPPFAPGLVYTWHKYWTDTTRAVFEEYVAFRTRHNVPIWLGETGENTDAWVGAFRRLVERDSIGWCFWPYKKMDAASCMVTFDRPEEYDVIVEYETRGRKTFEEMRTDRPSIEAVRAALDGFIQNCRFPNCRPNQGFLEALGLTKGPKLPVR